MPKPGLDTEVACCADVLESSGHDAPAPPAEGVLMQSSARGDVVDEALNACQVGVVVLGRADAGRLRQDLEQPQEVPFISSSALTVGQGCLAADELLNLAHSSEIVFALSFAGLSGNRSAFSEAAARASAAPGVADVAARLRGMLPDEGFAASRIQDPYALRVFAITHGAVVTALARLTEQLTGVLNAAQENPLFDIAGQTVVHHGAFYQAALALEVDGLNLALAQSSTITHARVRMMNEPAQTGLEPFLAAGPPGSSGVMMIEYVAAGAVAEIRNAAQPASLGTLALSRGAEEDATFTAQAVVQLERAIAAYRVLLSSELLCAVRLLRQLGRTRTLPDALSAAFDLCDRLPSEWEDRDLRDDLDTADELLDELASLPEQLTSRG